MSNPVLWTDPSGRCPWWLTAVCDATGLDPDNLDAGAYIKGGLGLNRDASAIEVVEAVAPYYIDPLGTYPAIQSTYVFVTDPQARYTFYHNLVSPSVWWEGVKRPWQKYGQGLQCHDAYLVGQGTVGIANELLITAGLISGGRAVYNRLRTRGAASSVLGAVPEQKQLNASQVEPIAQGPSPVQLQALQTMGVTQADQQAFFAGQAVSFSLAGAGDEAILGAVQLEGGRLRSGIISIRNLSGSGANDFARFRTQSFKLARALGINEVELFGGAIIKKEIAAMLERQGFIRKTETVPDAFGGGVMEVLAKVFQIK